MDSIFHVSYVSAAWSCRMGECGVARVWIRHDTHLNTSWRVMLRHSVHVGVHVASCFECVMVLLHILSTSRCQVLLCVNSQHTSRVVGQQQRLPGMSGASSMLRRILRASCNTLRHTATHFATLQHTATYWNTMQHNATQRHIVSASWCTCCVMMCGLHTLCHTATHYDTLQHTATHCNSCNTLRHTATQFATLQHTATYCNTLQHNATQRHILNASWCTCCVMVYMVYTMTF